MRLGYRPPLAGAAMLARLRAAAVPGLERGAPGGTVHTRVVMAPGGPALATIDLGADDGWVALTLRPADPRDVAHAVLAVRSWLDLDADPGPADRALAADPLLAPLVRARPGLRLPGSPDGFESLALAVLSAGRPPDAAREAAGRLVAAYGRPAAEGLSGFPDPAELADADRARLADAVGIDPGRAAALRDLAAAVAAGLDVSRRAAPARTRRRLGRIAGLDAWAIDIWALRSGGDRDAFVPDDPVLWRAMGVDDAAGARARAETWRPWRAHAAAHLWAEAQKPAGLG